MKAINELRKRRAVSPVIATIIIVAVTITVAVAASYWMSGIVGQYTAFEKVEIQSGWSEIEPTPGGWTITLEMKNSGSATANLIKVFVNDKPVNLYSTVDATTGAITLNTFGDTEKHTDTAEGILVGEATGTNIPVTGLAIKSGKTAGVISGAGTVDDPQVLNPIEVYIGSALFSPGTTINIKIHSAGGMDYIKLVRLT